MQEIYARLILYNFCEIITGTIIISQKDRKFIYQVNFTMAIYICIEFLRRKNLLHKWMLSLLLTTIFFLYALTETVRAILKHGL